MRTTENGGNILDSIKAWVFPLLLAAFGGLLQLQYNSIVSDMKEIKAFIQKSDRDHALYERDILYLTKKIEEHERWLEEVDNALYKRKN